jgi:hypothetical protein
MSKDENTSIPLPYVLISSATMLDLVVIANGGRMSVLPRRQTPRSQSQGSVPTSAADLVIASPTTR